MHNELGFIDLYTNHMTLEVSIHYRSSSPPFSSSSSLYPVTFSDYQACDVRPVPTPKFWFMGRGSIARVPPCSGLPGLPISQPPERIHTRLGLTNGESPVFRPSNPRTIYTWSQGLVKDWTGAEDQVQWEPGDVYRLKRGKVREDRQIHHRHPFQSIRLWF